jgi:glyoxylate/hydroxypyruvate reductase A
MALLFYSRYDDPQPWREHLRAADPSLELRAWPDVGNPRDIEAALVWKPPAGELRRYPNLKLVINLGAGVDSIIADPTLPPGVPIARIADPEMARMMAQFALAAVLRHHRDFVSFQRAMAEERWHYIHPKETRERTVAVLGLGQLGAAIALELARQRFRVLGWSRTPKSLADVECHAGDAALAGVLAQSDIVVALLPHTPATTGLIDARRFAQMPRGVAFVNLGRGATVDEPALVAALESGHVAEATLDVFAEEPLPRGHPFWRMPQVLVTPHLASVVTPRSSAAQVAENVRRARAGEPILNRVDPVRGY